MPSLGALFRRFFGSANERKLRAYRGKLPAIGALEEEMSVLSDDQLRAYTPMLRRRLREGAALDDLLVPAFAVVREAAKRVFSQRHFDVQLIGGMVLHDGLIAEMKTGEGKTLVATLPVYLNALAGGGVHVVTANDYLARRDAAWMGQLYEFLGLGVGVVTQGCEDDRRKAAYACDITYCTNNELGFDYLRDNMKHDKGQMVQRGHCFAIVDEVDSILIDEARTPLIISGPLEDRGSFYARVNEIVKTLDQQVHFEVSEKNRTVVLTEAGNERLEEILRTEGLLRGEGLYDVENVSLVHHIDQALKANRLFQNDRDYIVKDGSIVIIDEFTGRMTPGRRYAEGLHQALEAKEGVPIQPESQTLASITFQNYFRLYDKLAGMTGTAATEAGEFHEIYHLGLVEIPTNLPVARVDEDDEVYRTAEEKYTAVVNLIEERYARGQPVLVGTTSIAHSELLSRMLEERGFKQRGASTPIDSKKEKGMRFFQVLNARYHEQEAHIIAQAGIPGAITVATNMAGRGTDIQLGGNAEMRIQQELQGVSEGPEREQAEAAIRADVEKLRDRAIAAGGLCVIGTERHESRRIDNQLRGRSGRQGDPGSSRFFISLEDDLMRIFGSVRMDAMLGKLGLGKGEAIIHPWVNKALENAQRKVEARNFDIRRNLIKYDDVINAQRKVVFDQRLKMMDGESIGAEVRDMRREVVEGFVSTYIDERAYPEQWDVAGLEEVVEHILDLDLPIREWAKEEGITMEAVCQRLMKAADEAYSQKMTDVSSEVVQGIEKMILLDMLDHLWREHLSALDHLRQVVGLRGYGQRDPLNEFKTEALSLFEAMLDRLREMVTGQLMHGKFVHEVMPNPSRLALPVGDSSGDLVSQGDGRSPNFDVMGAAPRSSRGVPLGKKVGRNAPCPCQSGKKYKHCHGKLWGDVGS